MKQIASQTNAFTCEDPRPYNFKNVTPSITKQ